MQKRKIQNLNQRLQHLALSDPVRLQDKTKVLLNQVPILANTIAREGKYGVVLDIIERFMVSPGTRSAHDIHSHSDQRFKKCQNCHGTGLRIHSSVFSASLLEWSRYWT